MESTNESQGSSDVPSGLPEPPGVLYHYTTVAGFLGILESGSFRATDARFLNDSSELEFGIRYIKEEVVLRSSESWIHKVVEIAFSGAMPSDDIVGIVSYCSESDC